MFFLAGGKCDDRRSADRHNIVIFVGILLWLKVLMYLQYIFSISCYKHWFLCLYVELSIVK